MKKLSFTVKSLTAFAIVAAMASCSQNAEKANVAAAPAAPAAAQASAPVSNIRYIDADSVISAYTLAK